MSRRNRALASIAAASCALALIIPATATADPAVAVPTIASINITPVQGGDISTSATFSWHTAGTASTAPQMGIAIGLEDDFNCAAESLATAKIAPTPTIYSSVAYYHVAVTNLEPGEVYAYCVISSKGDRSPTYTYETHWGADSGTGFNFLAFGNPYWRSTSSYVNTFRQTVEEALDNFPEPAFLAIAGEYGSSSDLSHWDGLVSQHAQSVFASNMIVPTAHADSTSNRYFALGTGLPLASGSAYVTDNYAVRYGNTLFLSINTYRTSTADRNATLAWIDAQVAAVPEGTWIIAEIPTEFWGGHTTVINAAMRTALHAKFREIGVALVLQGRSEAYTRSWPIGDGTTPQILRNTGGDSYDEFMVEDGVIYITPGASGIEQENPSSGTYSATSGWLAAYTSYGSSSVNKLLDYKTYTLVDVDTDAIDVYAFTVAGQMIDHFTIGREETIDPNLWEVTPSSLSFPAQASLQTVTVNSGGAWTVASQPAGVTVTPASGGAGATVVTIATSSNTTTDTLTGSVQFARSGQSNLSVSITQAGLTIPAVWSVSKSSFEFTSAGGTETFNVSSDAAWSVVSQPSGVTVTPSSGVAGTTTVTVTVPANTSSSPWSAPIELARTGEPDAVHLFVQLSQAPKDWSVSSTTAQLTAAGSQSSAAVTVTSDAAWTAASSAAWLTVTPTSGLAGTTTLAFAATENTATATRSGVVTLKRTGQADLTVTVTQQGAPVEWGVSPASVTIASAAGSSATAEVSANTNWTVYSKPTWATVTPSSGTGSATITVTAASANTSTTADRTGTIVLRSPSNTSLTMSLTVVQSKATVWYATPTSLSFTAAGNALTTTVYSNGAWTLKAKPDWLTASATSGTGNLAVSLTAAPNNTTGTRNDVVVFAREGQPDVTVAVSQAWVTPWSVSATRADVAYRAGSTATVTLSTGVDWSVLSTPSWVTVSPSSGSVASGVATVELTITATTQSPSTAARSGVVYLRGTGKTNIAITVYQAGSPLWYASPTSLSFTAAGNTLTTTIYSNGAWTLKDKPDWITANRTSYTTSVAVTLTAAVNNTTGTRSGQVVFARDGEPDVIVNVTQAWVAPWSVSATRADVGYKAGSAATVTLTTGVNWTVLSKPAWVDVSPYSNSAVTGVETTELTITANAQNPTTAARSGIVYLQGTGKTNIAITVYQAAGPRWYASPTSLSFTAAGNALTTTVYSNGAWTLKDKPDWLTASATSGTGNLAVRLTAGPNNTTGTLSGQVVFARDGEPDVIVNVTQAWVAPWSVSSNRADINYSVGSSTTVTLTTGVNWQVSTYPSWVSVSPSSNTSVSGVVTETLTITATARNNAQTTRSGVVYLTATGKTTIAVTVYQAGSPLWYTNTSSLSYTAAGSTQNVILYANAAWTATAPDWITLSTSAGTTTTTVRVTAAPTTETTQRTGSIVFKRSGEEDVVVAVTQGGLTAETFVPTGINNGFGADPQTARVFTYVFPRSNTQLGTLTGATLTYAPLGVSLDSSAAITVNSQVAQATDLMSSYNVVTTTLGIGTLQPGTTYQYRITATTTLKKLTSAVYQFTTEAAVVDSFTFIAVADSQSDEGTYRTIWANTISTAITNNQDAAFVVHMGDITNDTERDEIEEWMEAVGSYLATPAFNPVLGNHDDRNNSGGRLWGQLVPRGTYNGWQMQYSYVYGNAVFIHLNLNHFTVSDLNVHAAYVRTIAEQYRYNPATGQERFIIVVQHKSPYGGNHAGSTKTGGDGYGAANIRTYLSPVFQTVGVDLVLAGHDHQYIRSCPILNTDWNCSQSDINTINSDTEGIVYLIPRNSGEKTYKYYSRPWDQVPTDLGRDDETVFGESMYSVITVTNTELRVSSYFARDPNNPWDSFVIVQNH